MANVPVLPYERASPANSDSPARANISKISLGNFSIDSYVWRQARSISPRSLGVVIASCLAYFSNQYSISAIAVHLYAIDGALHDHQAFVWFVNATSLMVMVTGPVIAYYTTFKTRKWLILGGLALGVAGQLMSSFAHTVDILTIGQALIGASLAVQPLLVTIPAEALSQNRRKIAQLATNIAGGFGGLSGAIIGGVILKSHTIEGDSTAWPWLFRLGAVLYGVTLVLFGITYRPLQVGPDAEESRPAFDWMGWCLFLFGIVPITVGLTFGGRPSSWNGLEVFLPLVVGGACLLLFVIWEIWGTKTGLFHHKMFKHGRNFPIILTLFFLEGILFVVFLVWYNQQVYEIFTDNPIVQGLRFAVFYGSITIFAPLVAVFCAKTKSIKSALVAGYMLIVLAVILMATSTLQSGNLVIFYAALAGVGLTAPLVTLMTSIQSAAPAELSHAVVPLATLMRTLGIVSANVLSDIVVNTLIARWLPARLSAALSPMGLTSQNTTQLIQAYQNRDEHLIFILTHTGGISPQVIQLAEETSNQVQMEAFRNVWFAVAALGGLAVMGSLAMAPMSSIANPKPDRPIPELSATQSSTLYSPATTVSKLENVRASVVTSENSEYLQAEEKY